jgi:hypothetical protein
VLQRIPKFLDRPTVLGIGEIGMNRITRNEIATYTEQVELAIAHRQLILIHTPHLEDKLKGTRISVDVLRRYREIDPSRVLIDHAEEHTIEMILEHGFWAGLTLYPQTKISPQRAVDVIEKYGPERICVAGACDWGPSDPIAVPRFAMEMRRRHHSDSLIEQVVFENPVAFLSQSPKFNVTTASARSPRGRLTRPGLASRSGRRLSPDLLHEHPCRRRLGGESRQRVAVRAGVEAAIVTVLPFGIGLRLRATLRACSGNRLDEFHAFWTSADCMSH